MPAKEGRRGVLTWRARLAFALWRACGSLHLKDEASAFSDQYHVKELIKKYSEFINFPIYLWMTRRETVEMPKAEKPADDEGVADVTEEEEEVEEEEIEVTRPERLNENKPIWTRSPDELTKEDYIEFYKLFSKDEYDPITYTHFKVRRRCVQLLPGAAVALTMCR